MPYGRNTPMKIKPDSGQEKGWTDLTDSLYSLRKDMTWDLSLFSGMRSRDLLRNIVTSTSIGVIILA